MHKNVDMNDLVVITDQVNLAAYIESETIDGKEVRNVILRIYDADEHDYDKNRFSYAIRLGPFFSPKVLEHFDENGKLRPRKNVDSEQKGADD